MKALLIILTIVTAADFVVTTYQLYLRKKELKKNE